ncbi:hypothetical protein H0H92_015905 [Tricholoma furcatifolium]|nr:hypothetical protein H0H92_015905 [Tricholoma furcatifolium]
MSKATDDKVESDRQADGFWSFYVAETALHDSNVTGTWKSDMKNTLIFAGLFSATVTAFIIESQKLLQQDPAVVTNHLLTQLLAAQQSGLGATNTSSSVLLPSSIPAFPFQVSKSAIAINIFWFTSLVFTLGAALCCILVLQLVQHFSQRVQRPTKPMERARVRAFLADGIERWKVESIVNYIPTLLHLSLFLFLAGLVVFLANLCITVSAVVAAVVLLFVVLYSVSTLAPFLDLASPFETLFTRSSTRLSVLKFGPGDMQPPPPDVSALTWARETFEDATRFEKFLITIPEFLSISSGHKTWAAAYDDVDSSHTLQKQICNLLMACSPTNSMNPSDLDASERRALVCIEALCSISRHEAINCPLRSTGQYTIPRLSDYVALAIKTKRHGSVPITKGICTLSVLTRQNFFQRFTLSPLPARLSLRSRVPKRIVDMSYRADKALEDIKDLQHNLEAKFKEYSTFPPDYEVGIQNVVQQTFDTLKTASKDLLDWRRNIVPLFDEWEVTRHHELFEWYFLLPSQSYVLKYSEFSQIDLYAFQVMALMRRLGVHGPLPAVTSNGFVTTLPVGQLDQALSQELDPLYRLLSLQNSGLADKIIDSGESLADLITVPFPNKRPILVEHLGPFRTVAYILEDIKDNRAAVVSILDLVMRFQSLAPQAVEAYIVREFLENALPHPKYFNYRHEHIEFSATLFIAVVHVILQWEKKASCSKPFPFSSSNIQFLLDILQNIQYNNAARVADRLLVSSPSARCIIDSEVKNTRISPMQAIYNQITAGRQ